MSKLLLNEQPLLIIASLAERIGLNESIILQQIHYWNEINRKANNNFRDGHYWTFNSYNDWKKQFPFWSERTIQRTIKNLESYKLIVVGNYNKLKIDRTKWYRIDYKVLEALETSPFGQNGTINMTKWLDHLDNLGLPLPETNTKTNPENNHIHHPANDDNLVDLLEIFNGYIIKDYVHVRSEYKNKKHPRIRTSSIDYIYECIETLENEYEDNEHLFKETVREYFEQLPEKNNGNILAFFEAYYRFGESDLRKEKR